MRRLFWWSSVPLGRVVTKLLQAVWPDSFVEEGNLSQNIFLLRKALTTRKPDSRYIVTIPGRGYHFASAVEIVNQLPQSGANLSGGNEMVLNSVRSTMHVVVHEEIDDTPIAPVFVERRQPILAIATRNRLLLRYSVTMLLVMVAAIAALLWWKSYHKQTESVKLVLADFDNRTGDPAFDAVLKKALENSNPPSCPVNPSSLM
jgi:eukaryotic-like serine/threonine-protein kinase